MAPTDRTGRPGSSRSGRAPVGARGRRSAAAAGLLVGCLLVAACGADAGDPAADGGTQRAAATEPSGRGGSSSDATSSGTATDGTATARAADEQGTGGDGARSADAGADAAARGRTGDPGPTVTVTTPPVTPDALAGVLSQEIPHTGDGRLSAVPGASSPPGPGRVRTLRVAVEGGLPVDGQAFAAFVLGTLNDPRSWARDGYAFARTDSEADTELVLASPATSEQLCRPLRTMGTLSCRNGNRVVLTWYRWVTGHEDFGGDLTLYRQYLVNHEVGHSLGHGHLGCPGAGALAPVMMQQTKGVRPCLPNAWPYP